MEYLLLYPQERVWLLLEPVEVVRSNAFVILVPMMTMDVYFSWMTDPPLIFRAMLGRITLGMQVYLSIAFVETLEISWNVPLLCSH